MNSMFDGFKQKFAAQTRIPKVTRVGTHSVEEEVLVSEGTHIFPFHNQGT